MNPNDDNFEILPADKMQQKYGLYAENRPIIQLDPGKVPASVHKLIPLAQIWGIGDDLIRDDLIKKAPVQALKELKRAVGIYTEALEDWLTGPEADAETFSDEYIAFSCMMIAADSVQESED